MRFASDILLLCQLCHLCHYINKINKLSVTELVTEVTEEATPGREKAGTRSSREPTAIHASQAYPTAIPRTVAPTPFAVPITAGTSTHVPRWSWFDCIPAS